MKNRNLTLFGDKGEGEIKRGGVAVSVKLVSIYSDKQECVCGLLVLGSNV